MVENILAWTGCAVLLLLCLPFRGVRKLILEACGLTLRIALLGVLAGGAFLWFRPELLPSQAVNILFSIAGVRDLLPAPGSQVFGLAAAALIVAVFLPLLAILDVTRRLAGWPLRHAAPVPSAPLPAPGELKPHQTVPLAGPRRHDRREAAEKMAEIGSRRPFRVADDVR